MEVGLLAQNTKTTFNNQATVGGAFLPHSPPSRDVDSDPSRTIPNYALKSEGVIFESSLNEDSAKIDLNFWFFMPSNHNCCI